MRDAARDLPECAQPLGFQLALARGGECGRQLAQRLPQGFELRGAALQPSGRQLGVAADQRCPADELVDGSRKLPREVAGQVHSRVEHSGAEEQDHQRKARRVVAQEGFGPAGETDRFGHLIEVLTQQCPLRHGEVQSIDALEQGSGGRGHAFRRRARACGR